MGEGVVKLLFPLTLLGNLPETDTYSAGNGKFRDHASREMADKGEDDLSRVPVVFRIAESLRAWKLDFVYQPTVSNSCIAEYSYTTQGFDY